MSHCGAPQPREDALTRLVADLRTQLRGAAEGAAFEPAAALEQVMRLEKLVKLLRSTALQSFGEFEQRLFELSLFRSVGNLFSSVFERERLIPALVELVSEALSCDVVLLYRAIPETQGLELACGSGPPLSEEVRARFAKSAREASMRRLPAWLVDLQVSPARSLFCPIVAQSEVLGVLAAVEQEEDSLSEGAMRTVADLAAVALRHAALWDRYRSQQADLEGVVEERTREVNEARATLSRQERVAAMGKLAASIAHEVNNPMSFMISNLARAAEGAEAFHEALPGLLAVVDLARKLPDGESPEADAARSAALCVRDAEHGDDLEATVGEFRELIQEAQEGADRIRHVGDQLRGFARGFTGAMEPVDLNGLIETAVHVARAEAKDRIEFECRLGLLPQVRCHRYQVVQLLLNLLQNAVEAIDGRGSVRVTTRAAESFVEVEVADEGPGIPAESVEDVFEPFYTTKAQGTGLGLSVSRDIARVHRGTLEAVASPEGAVFRFRLPVS